MVAKNIFHSTNARDQMARGLDELADAVKVTLGPHGRNVVKGIDLENRCANIGAQTVKEVASKMADVAGEGTTTATVLAQPPSAAALMLTTEPCVAECSEGPAGYDPADAAT